MTCIIDDVLYLAGIGEVTERFLEENEIKTVFNVAKECDSELPMKMGIKCYKYELVDAVMDFYESMDEIVDLMKERITQGAILIHCYAGFSRSATIVLAFLIKINWLPLYEAFWCVHEKRNILPHPKFMNALMKYEMQKLGLETFKKYIDNYTINYIIIAHRMSPLDFEMIQKVYELHNKEFDATVIEVLTPYSETLNEYLTIDDDI